MAVDLPASGDDQVRMGVHMKECEVVELNAFGFPKSVKKGNDITVIVHNAAWQGL